MRILLNGDPADVPDALSIQGLLDHLGLDGRLVAVELNRVVIRRASYATTTIDDGAEVEIVKFVGGG
jgi:sulfur carrier protein